MPRAFRDFGQDEDGGMLPFAMTLLLIMMTVGGLAVDVMRHEEKRVLLQQTLDRSVLAAASLRQELDPEAVVNDFFEKAGLAQYLTSVTVDEGLNFRSVSAEADADTNPFFMHMMGIDQLTVSAGSGAEERISNVEVSLVLDISGSMAGSRINGLRPAAREFVSTILNNSEPGRATISIVPYSAQVNLGTDLMAQFNATQVQNKTYCVELPSGVFSSISLSTGTSFVHNGHFDPFNNYSSQSYANNTNASMFNCSYHSTAPSANTVLALSGDIPTLHNKINALVVEGNTSIDLGVKWGALLLDPAARTVTAGLVSRNAVQPQFANRPLNFNNQETIKVLVVMTDGQNTTEYRLKAPYNGTGLSDVYRNSSGQVSVYYDRANTSYDYYRPASNNWATAAYSNSTRLTWPQVFERWNVSHVAYYFFARPRNQNYNTWVSNLMESIWSDKNSKLQTICSAAKNAGILVYTIAYEAPYDGQTQLRNCASGDPTTNEGTYYYPAIGSDQIATVFRSIANQISFLRLTQ
ncbi:VWA domain-containing protein [Gemmobacter denitrificans]|uniref:VWA domain-containing protein n=1 Tax=Gemmobacter denitrificans TaxID=3123040 RepID=A0ABU8BXR7_9RHOB